MCRYMSTLIVPAGRYAFSYRDDYTGRSVSRHGATARGGAVVGGRSDAICGLTPDTIGAGQFNTSPVLNDARAFLDRDVNPTAVFGGLGHRRPVPAAAGAPLPTLNGAPFDQYYRRVLTMVELCFYLDNAAPMNKHTRSRNELYKAIALVRRYLPKMAMFMSSLSTVGAQVSRPVVPFLYASVGTYRLDKADLSALLFGGEIYTITVNPEARRFTANAQYELNQIMECMVYAHYAARTIHHFDRELASDGTVHRVHKEGDRLKMVEDFVNACPFIYSQHGLKMWRSLFSVVNWNSLMNFQPAGLFHEFLRDIDVVLRGILDRAGNMHSLGYGLSPLMVSRTHSLLGANNVGLNVMTSNPTAVPEVRIISMLHSLPKTGPVIAKSVYFPAFSIVPTKDPAEFERDSDSSSSLVTVGYSFATDAEVKGGIVQYSQYLFPFKTPYRLPLVRPLLKFFTPTGVRDVTAVTALDTSFFINFETLQVKLPTSVFS